MRYINTVDNVRCIKEVTSAIVRSRLILNQLSCYNDIVTRIVVGKVRKTITIIIEIE